MRNKLNINRAKKDIFPDHTERLRRSSMLETVKHLFNFPSGILKNIVNDF